jgi:queuine tRNA-ribosyltransferase
MVVGTQGSVKGLSARDLEEVGAGIVLGNTYHLALRPGVEVIEAAGGLHRFMGWDGPVLTDSGGYQIFSLPTLVRVTDDEVAFASHIDGSRLALSPERAIELQGRMGSDIAMQLDHVVGYPASRQEAADAMRRSLAWARRSREAAASRAPAGAGFFGIVQGSTYWDLRAESARGLAALDLDGYAIGGVSVGEPRQLMFEAVERTVEHLPPDRPRYLMGMGLPGDLLDGVARGVDMFDCVIPTRNARNGQLFTRSGLVRIRRSCYTYDFRPPDPDCGCRVCGRYTRSYMRHLFKAGEMLGPVLASYHNVWFYLELMREAREAIERGRFAEFAAERAPATGDADDFSDGVWRRPGRRG